MKIIQLLALSALMLLGQSSATSSAVRGVRQSNDRRRKLKKNKSVKGPSSRSCNFSQKKGDVSFSCKAQSTSQTSSGNPNSRGIILSPAQDIRDEINYKISTKKKGISVEVAYKESYLANLTTNRNNKNVETTFEVNFDKVIEYAKGNSSSSSQSRSSNSSQDEAYDFANDQIIQSIALTKFDSFSSVISDKAGVVSYFNTTTADGIVGFNFTVSRADTGQKASANTMKIDVLITDFPWKRNDTYLALMSAINSNMRVSVDYVPNATLGNGPLGHPNATGGNGPLGHPPARPTSDVQINFNQATSHIGYSPFGKYRWQNSAEATTWNNNNIASNLAVLSDNTANSGNVVVNRQGSNSTAKATGYTSDTIQVVATSPDQLGNDTFKVVAYSFVGDKAHNASRIYWDPETGVGYYNSNSAAAYNNSGVFGLGYATNLFGALLVSTMLFVL